MGKRAAAAADLREHDDLIEATDNRARAEDGNQNVSQQPGTRPDGTEA